MEIIGIICEYNPFHNGHIYHLNEIKKKYPDSLIMLILNGYFLERGEISIISKYDKTQIALNYGVDIVIELPVLYGTQSADHFAYYAVKLLNMLHVNRIIFGSESNNIELLTKIASETASDKYSEKIQEYLNKGFNYPSALAKAINIKFEFKPNDLLAISYIKAINEINNKIIPETILRTNDYLDINSNDNIVSASNIREKIKNNIQINNFVPKETINKINNIDEQIFFKMLKIIILNNNNLNEILDVDEGIENRLYKGIIQCKDLNEFREFIKTKRYTYNKINRLFIHLLLNIKKEDATLPIDYLKVLGFNLKGRKYLQKIKKDLLVPLGKNKSSKVYDYEIKASIIYDILTNNNTYQEENNSKPIIF